MVSKSENHFDDVHVVGAFEHDSEEEIKEDEQADLMKLSVSKIYSIQASLTSNNGDTRKNCSEARIQPDESIARITGKNFVMFVGIYMSLRSDIKLLIILKRKCFKYVYCIPFVC